MKKILLMFTTAMLLLALVACGTNSPQPENEQGTPDSNGQNEETPQDENISEGGENNEERADTEDKEHDRPASKTDVISIEGMDEEFSFQLHENKALGFSTYIVEDMLAESNSSSEGDSLVVFANFGGNKNEDAAVHFFSPSNDSDVAQLIEQTEEELTSQGFEMKESSPVDVDSNPLQLDVQYYSLESSDLVGRAMFFEHKERPYVIYYHYPIEFGDGFDPRVNKLLEDIIWYK